MAIVRLVLRVMSWLSAKKSWVRNPHQAKHICKRRNICSGLPVAETIICIYMISIRQILHAACSCDLIRFCIICYVQRDEAGLT